MKNKICLITGANSGIGKAAAIQIAQMGYNVIIGVRNKERGKVALAEIKKKSKSDLVEMLEVDLSLKNSISKAANLIKENYNKLDVLIHNAAGFDISQKVAKTTSEGVETIWATNHIGPVFLTDQLLDLLKKSGDGRIITVASKGLMAYPKLKINLNDPEFKTRKFSVSKAYYQSKLAQVMYTYYIAIKLSSENITANCIRVTNVKIDIDRYPNVSRFMKYMYSIKSKFSISPEEMAKTYTYLASSEALKNTSGKYFNEKNEEVSSSKYSMNEANIEALMNLTAAYIS